MIDRRLFIGGAGALLAGPALAAPVVARRPRDRIGDVQRRTFAFFRDTTDRTTGLALDRWPTPGVSSPGFSSIAAIGFALTAWPVGVARGWMTRGEARDRTLACLRLLWRLPQGDAPGGIAGHRGFFYHFLDAKTGLRFRDTELSSIDTALLMAGVLFAGGWFDRAEEREIRDLAHKLYARVEWGWMQDRLAAGDARFSMGWRPGRGFIPTRWFGYTEALLLYILALGSPTHGVGADAYAGYTGTYDEHWRDGGQGRFLAGAPQFWHQYTHCWIDLRGIRDAPMRAAGFDYFENSRRATLAQRDYAIRNPGGWAGYGADVWGLTASDGPGGFTRRIDGRERVFRGYSARGPVGQPDGFDDGTIAPTAAVASLPFAPDVVERAVAAMQDRYGRAIYGRYGFVDAFNPTLTAGPVGKGRIVAGIGWVDDDHLGIDQGPIVAAVENHRSGLIWSVMRAEPNIRRGLPRAGFTGGWLGA